MATSLASDDDTNEYWGVVATKKDSITVRIDQSGKFSVITLLRAMDPQYGLDADILRTTKAAGCGPPFFRWKFPSEITLSAACIKMPRYRAHARW